jgi:hypothetical protein
MVEKHYHKDISYQARIATSGGLEPEPGHCCRKRLDSQKWKTLNHLNHGKILRLPFLGVPAFLSVVGPSLAQRPP